jgi:hypothetical protein
MSDVSPRSIDPSARMQIYFQGILDGACFLYAPANAYKALTGKRVPRDIWNQAITRVPDPAAFLGGPGATELHHEDARRLLEAILEELSDPDESFVIDQLSPGAGIVDLCAEVSTASVVLFAFGGRTEFQHPVAHIVCAVATSEGPPATLHLACSTAFWGRYLQTGEYAERHHSDLDRWSNDSISADHPVTIAPNFRWRITRSSRHG